MLSFPPSKLKSEMNQECPGRGWSPCRALPPWREVMSSAAIIRCLIRISTENSNINIQSLQNRNAVYPAQALVLTVWSVWYAPAIEEPSMEKCNFVLQRE